MRLLLKFVLPLTFALIIGVTEALLMLSRHPLIIVLCAVFSSFSLGAGIAWVPIRTAYLKRLRAPARRYVIEIGIIPFLLLIPLAVLYFALGLSLDDINVLHVLGLIGGFALMLPVLFFYEEHKHQI
jgi:hypothetical protein